MVNTEILERSTLRPLISVLGIVALLSSACSGTAVAEELSNRALIPSGDFSPQYGPGGSKKPVPIKSFHLDKTPVTNSEYSDFLKKNSQWLPEKMTKLFAEEKYLSDWMRKGRKLEPPPTKANYPVVNVSYFAASAFCEWRGGRLPTTIEWEYAAYEDPKLQLEWFSNPKPPGPVGKNKPNRFGVQDMHGQVWEWTMDYNSSFATADNRQDGELDKNFFCGSGSMNAKDRENYPAFMRYAMRSALRPNYVMGNLGFRCAYDSK